MHRLLMQIHKTNNLTKTLIEQFPARMLDSLEHSCFGRWPMWHLK